MSRSTISSTTIRDNLERSRYELFVEGELAGYLAYRRSKGLILITSTQVLPAYRGRGLASQLVQAAMDDVREEGLTVQTTCWYVDEWLESHPAPAQ
jgi:predicted GNAT family acetyltransferase